MKTYYKLIGAVLPFALLAASCQDENIVESGNKTGEGIITLHATVAPQSRAQIALGTEDASREIFMWNENDSFVLYDRSNPTVTSGTFTISAYTENEHGPEATFVGEGNFVQDMPVTAIYPAQEGNVTENAATLTLPDVTMTDGSEDEWKDYMRQSLFMYADATMDGNNTALAFRHLCALIRVSYTNATATDQTISNVTLTGDGNYFGSTMKFGFVDNGATTTVSSDILTFGFSGLTVASGRTTDFYFLFFPGEDASAGTLTVRINGKTIEMSLDELLSGNFEAGKRYWFNTIETDDGFIWKKDVPEVLITNLPLIQLAEKLNSKVQFEKDEKGFVNVALNQAQISQVKYLNGADGNLDNLDGLEYFTSLEALYVNEMGLTALDVSKLTDLQRLSCYNNPDLGHLDVSANTKLQDLSCDNTGLSELDVTKNTELVFLTCGYNDIAELDLSQNLKLKELNIQYNNVISSSSIDNIIADCPGLTYLVVSNCPNITELDVSQCTQLEMLGCDGTGISSLDVSQNTALDYLACEFTSISSLDVSRNTKLETLWCGRTQITELNLTNNPLLSTLSCQGLENIAEIDISKNTALTNLFLSGAKITKLDVSNQPLLKELLCHYTNITELDVSQNPELVRLWCNGISITSLDVSHNPKLNDLQCYGCGLTELDITNNPVLMALMCGNQYQFNPTTGTGPIDMILYLTEEQKQNLIDGNMEWDANNARVIPTIKGTAD